MKENIAKLIVGLASVALVLPFVSVAFLVGARAVSDAQGVSEQMLLAALALGGAAASVFKNASRRAETGQSRETALHLSSTPNANKHSRGAFVRVHSH